MQYTFREELKACGKNSRSVTIWNTESSRSLHERLKRVFRDRYVSSEYFGALKSGEVVNGFLQQDICRTSFRSDSFDFILSSDVLEHVPEPEEAFREVHRVLKPGGKFIFTAPFGEGMPQSDFRARLKKDGSVEYLKEPSYHGDPLRPEGILVYVIFGEDLFGMCEKAGLICNKRKLYRPFYGIIGSNAIIFVAQKPLPSPSGQG